MWATLCRHQVGRHTWLLAVAKTPRCGGPGRPLVLLERLVSAYRPFYWPSVTSRLRFVWGRAGQEFV
jgi:hypothetical protein